MAIESGVPFSVEMTTYIKTYIETQDINDLAYLHRISKESVRGLLRGEKITKRTHPIALGLAKRSFKRRDGSFNQMEQVHKEFKKELEGWEVQ